MDNYKLLSASHKIIWNNAVDIGPETKHGVFWREGKITEIRKRKRLRSRR